MDLLERHQEILRLIYLIAIIICIHAMSMAGYPRTFAHATLILIFVAAAGFYGYYTGLLIKQKRGRPNHKEYEQEIDRIINSNEYKYNGKYR